MKNLKVTEYHSANLCRGTSSCTLRILWSIQGPHPAFRTVGGGGPSGVDDGGLLTGVWTVGGGSISARPTPK